MRRALEAAERIGSPEPLRGTADMHVAQSLLDLERNDLASAAEHLRRSDELGDAAGLPQNAYRWRVALARLRVARGDTASAVDLLTEAERVYVGDFLPQCPADRRDARPGPCGRRVGCRRRSSGSSTAASPPPTRRRT